MSDTSAQPAQTAQTEPVVTDQTPAAEPTSDTSAQPAQTAQTEPVVTGQTPAAEPTSDTSAQPAQEVATGQTPAAEPTSDTSAQPTQAATPTQEKRTVRVGTVVWGLVLTAIGVGMLAAALGVAFDVELAFIVLVATAGVLLLVGSVVNSRNEKN